MFSFFKKSSLISFPAAEILQSDMHNHVLPGIDDGSPDIESSMELIGTMFDAGYKRIVATPHIYKEFYPNSRDTVSEAFDTIAEKVKEQFPKLSFSFAAEYFLDEHFEDLLDQKALMPFRDNHVLIEQGFFAPYKKLKEVIFNIQTKGYIPVLAHPERYPYYYAKPEKLQELQENGVLLQLNLLAFANRYGKDCLLYTSDAADERSSVDLGGRRIIKKKHNIIFTADALYKITVEHNSRSKQNKNRN